MLAQSKKRTGGSPGRGAAEAFDFRKPNKLNGSHHRTLQTIHDTFAEELSVVLSSNLRMVSTITVANIQQTTLDEYLRGAPNPTHLAILLLDPLPGAAVLELPIDLALVAVDLMLGGPGRPVEILRPLTEIECGLVSTLVDRILDQVTKGFEPFVALDPQVLETESNPQFAPIGRRSDLAIAATFDVHLGEAESTLSLVYPYMMLEPVLEAAATSAAAPPVPKRAETSPYERLVRERLQEVEVELCVDFPPAPLTGADVLSLRVGDVIMLGHRTDSTLVAAVDGVPVFEVRPARSGERLACQIVARAAGRPSPKRSNR